MSDELVLLRNVLLEQQATMHRGTSAEGGSAAFARLHVAAARSASDSSLQSLDAPSRERGVRWMQQPWTLGGWLRSRAPSPASAWAFCVGAALGMVLMSTFFLGATLHRDSGSSRAAVTAAPLVHGSSALQADHAASAAEAMLRAAAALAAGLDRASQAGGERERNGNFSSTAGFDRRASQSDGERDRNGASVDSSSTGSSLADVSAATAEDTARAGASEHDDDGHGSADDEAEDDYVAGPRIDGAPEPASHNRAAWVALRAAALVASSRGSAVGVNSRVAFLFLTRGPLPHAPLWERFFTGHESEYVIHVHAAPGFELNASTVASPVFYGRTVTKSVYVAWGEMSVVAAERRLFASALLDSSVTRLVLLSESCVPLRSFRCVRCCASQLAPVRTTG